MNPEPDEEDDPEISVLAGRTEDNDEDYYDIDETGRAGIKTFLCKLFLNYFEPLYFHETSPLDVFTYFIIKY